MEIVSKRPSTGWSTGDAWFDTVGRIDGRSRGCWNLVHFASGARTGRDRLMLLCRHLGIDHSGL
jgi:hypothetical protein